MRTVVAVVALLGCVHAGLWAIGKSRIDAPDFNGQFPSLSYTPSEGSERPDRSVKPVSAARIRADMQVLAPYTRAIRTYAATDGADRPPSAGPDAASLVPGVANEFGLRVTAGAWLGSDAKRNERELRAVVEQARRHSNIEAIVIGNETVYRGETILVGAEKLELSPEESGRLQAAKARNDADEIARVQESINVARLIRHIQRVKRETQVPVTTGEIWSVWQDHPELVSAVDFIAVHILPYWEGKPDTAAVDEAIGAYNRLRQMYPGKRIVIAEFGWPSAGYNLMGANPGRIEQAAVLRDFVSRADALGIDYNIIEAIDQQWKTAEGSVGAYWGIFDSARQPKFAWSGPILEPDHWKNMTLAVLFGLLLSLPLLGMREATFAQATMLGTGAHVAGAWFAAIVAFWNQHYFVFGTAFALALGIVLLVPLVLIAMARVEEIAAVAFGRKPRRLIASPSLAPEGFGPKVSIHIPAYREPPEMLKATLDAVASLTYPNFECVVIINNTPDPEFWEPVEEHCRTLGERFKFLRVDNLEGFKAGALRLALNHTAPDAEIIGVIDADYIVTPDWLTHVVPAFADAKVGLVQAPQDHRDGDRSLMHRAMNAEYSGFFDIGMVQRNEKNAIVVHGTMCLMRRSALEAAGSWSSDTICEDTDLGLTMIELGWKTHYTNRRYGFGLLPDTFEQFKKQRHRWAYGGVQIVKKHWRRFLPGVSKLTRDQRREFLLGWLVWLGAEALGVVVAVLNLLWVPVVAFAGIAIPDKILTIPIIAAFVVTILHFITLYRLRVAVPRGHMLGAVVAAMSVQWTVARAVGDGVIKDHLPFNRTAKGNRAAKKAREFQAFWEALFGALLIAGAIVLVATNKVDVREINIFAGVLVLQSLPFLSAALLAAIEGTRFNEHAYWTSLVTRAVEVLPRRAAAIAAPAPIEKPADTVPQQ
jgi:cellulose synthase/poly-beta-1,6-N-acetylglucosamine synthase-like glycosyltransferase/exo-beta-1,3-glucanase (GH17 family)